MTDNELIIAQAKKLAQQDGTIEYYRAHCKSLENQIRVQNNITESGDDLPLSLEGLKNKCKVSESEDENV